MRHDHLRRRVHRGLGVVGLHEAVAALHDPAFGIGEVALRARLRLAGRVLRLAAAALARRAVGLGPRIRPGGLGGPRLGLKFRLRGPDPL